ncbi:MAG: ammonium transporter [Deltaproteobacteria bacterium]|jgi:Amt family ammonium transporter|nr:ammonium transporter [Deltaproteobacteria bacterium]
MNSGDTGFVLVAAALVFIMTPGLGFFYGGLGRRKNVINNIMASTFILGLGIFMWVLIGYSLSFTGDNYGIIGSLSNFGLKDIGFTDPSPYAPTIPSLAFVAFQMMFALITPAIITGAVAGRMNFKALFIFIALWSIVVYYPLAHMVWGNGYLGANGIQSIDFAGGNVVHISSGVSGLVLCILLGKRQGYASTSYRVHNVPFVALGMAMLWFGWFGFNAGSALAANELAAHAFMTTAIATAAGLLSWMAIDMVLKNKPTLISTCTGVVVGLVAITPGAGFVPIWAALIIGASAGPVCYFGITLIKKRLKIDDALDAFGCHGIGGIWGGIMTGVFANPIINSGANPGLVYANFAEGFSKGCQQFIAQIEGVLISIAVAAIGTLICAFIVKLITPLRVSKRDELIGLDMSQHGENAYPSFTGLD